MTFVLLVNTEEVPTHVIDTLDVNARVMHIIPKLSDFKSSVDLSIIPLKIIEIEIEITLNYADEKKFETTIENIVYYVTPINGSKVGDKITFLVPDTSKMFIIIGNYFFDYKMITMKSVLIINKNREMFTMIAALRGANYIIQYTEVFVYDLCGESFLRYMGMPCAIIK